MMIKKEYIAPAIEVIEMEVTHMLANSVLNGGGIVTKPGDEPTEELSNRRRNFWDEIGEK